MDNTCSVDTLSEMLGKMTSAGRNDGISSGLDDFGSSCLTPDLFPDEDQEIEDHSTRILLQSSIPQVPQRSETTAPLKTEKSCSVTSSQETCLPEDFASECELDLEVVTLSLDDGDNTTRLGQRCSVNPSSPTDENRFCSGSGCKRVITLTDSSENDEEPIPLPLLEAKLKASKTPSASDKVVEDKAIDFEAEAPVGSFDKLNSTNLVKPYTDAANYLFNKRLNADDCDKKSTNEPHGKDKRFGVFYDDKVLTESQETYLEIPEYFDRKLESSEVQSKSGVSECLLKNKDDCQFIQEAVSLSINVSKPGAKSDLEESLLLIDELNEISSSGGGKHRNHSDIFACEQDYSHQIHGEYEPGRFEELNSNSVTATELNISNTQAEAPGDAEYTLVLDQERQDVDASSNKKLSTSSPGWCLDTNVDLSDQAQNSTSGIKHGDFSCLEKSEKERTKCSFLTGDSQTRSGGTTNENSVVIRKPKSKFETKDKFENFEPFKNGLHNSGGGTNRYRIPKIDATRQTNHREEGTLKRNSNIVTRKGTELSCSSGEKSNSDENQISKSFEDKKPSKHSVSALVHSSAGNTLTASPVPTVLHSAYQSMHKKRRKGRSKTVHESFANNLGKRKLPDYYEQPKTKHLDESRNEQKSTLHNHITQSKRSTQSTVEETLPSSAHEQHASYSNIGAKSSSAPQVCKNSSREQARASESREIRNPNAFVRKPFPYSARGRKRHGRKIATVSSYRGKENTGKRDCSVKSSDINADSLGVNNKRKMRDSGVQESPTEKDGSDQKDNKNSKVTGDTEKFIAPSEPSFSKGASDEASSKHLNDSSFSKERKIIRKTEACLTTMEKEEMLRCDSGTIDKENVEKLNMMRRALENVMVSLRASRQASSTLTNMKHEVQELLVKIDDLLNPKETKPVMVEKRKRGRPPKKRNLLKHFSISPSPPTPQVATGVRKSEPGDAVSNYSRTLRKSSRRSLHVQDVVLSAPQKNKLLSHAAVDDSMTQDGGSSSRILAQQTQEKYLDGAVQKASLPFKKRRFDSKEFETDCSAKDPKLTTGEDSPISNNESSPSACKSITLLNDDTSSSVPKTDSVSEASDAPKNSESPTSLKDTSVGLDVVPAPPHDRQLQTSQTSTSVTKPENKIPLPRSKNSAKTQTVSPSSTHGVPLSVPYPLDKRTTQMKGHTTPNLFQSKLKHGISRSDFPDSGLLHQPPINRALVAWNNYAYSTGPALYEPDIGYEAVLPSMPESVPLVTNAYGYYTGNSANYRSFVPNNIDRVQVVKASRNMNVTLQKQAENLGANIDVGKRMSPNVNKDQSHKLSSADCINGDPVPIGRNFPSRSQSKPQSQNKGSTVTSSVENHFKNPYTFESSYPSFIPYVNNADPYYSSNNGTAMNHTYYVQSSPAPAGKASSAGQLPSIYIVPSSNVNPMLSSDYYMYYPQNQRNVHSGSLKNTYPYKIFSPQPTHAVRPHPVPVSTATSLSSSLLKNPSVNSYQGSHVKDSHQLSSESHKHIPFCNAINSAHVNSSPAEKVPNADPENTNNARKTSDACSAAEISSHSSEMLVPITSNAVLTAVTGICPDHIKSVPKGTVVVSKAIDGHLQQKSLNICNHLTKKSTKSVTCISQTHGLSSSAGPKYCVANTFPSSQYICNQALSCSVASLKSTEEPYNLQHLIKSGCIHAGLNVLSTFKNDIEYFATLTEDGQIKSQGGETFRAPHLWYRAIKNVCKVSKRSAWENVYYKGRSLISIQEANENGKTSGNSPQGHMSEVVEILPASTQTNCEQQELSSSFLETFDSAVPELKDVAELVAPKSTESQTRNNVPPLSDPLRLSPPKDAPQKEPTAPSQDNQLASVEIENIQGPSDLDVLNHAIEGMDLDKQKSTEGQPLDTEQNPSSSAIIFASHQVQKKEELITSSQNKLPSWLWNEQNIEDSAMPEDIFDELSEW